MKGLFNLQASQEVKQRIESCGLQVSDIWKDEPFLKGGPSDKIFCSE